MCASGLLMMIGTILLAEVLQEFAGQLAVYGDVDKKLQKSMNKMKSVVESVDIEALEKMRRENEDQIRANFAEQREMKMASRNREERADSWNEAAAAAEIQKHSENIDEEDSKMTSKTDSEGRIITNPSSRSTKQESEEAEM